MNIAIVGLGVVGRGVYDILNESHKDIHIKYVLELDDEKLVGIDAIRAKDIFEILHDHTVDTVIELVGGKGFAKTVVTLALEFCKNVVTANKALVSENFDELTKLARINQVSLRYEASVGGAINIIDPLLTIQKINKIHKIQGIINGSTNFILSKVFIEDYSLKKALAEAYELGYLETGSNDDLEGFDLLRKINILSMLSYNQIIQESDISRVPLTNLTSDVIDYIKSKALTVKYVATSILENNQIMIHLEPVIMSKENFYTHINYEDNIIDIFGAYHKKQSFIGQGAGRYPTAQAVVYDVLKLSCLNRNSQKFENTYGVNNDIKAYPFLILEDGLIKKTEPTTFTALNTKDITILGRIEDDVYEKI